MINDITTIEIQGAMFSTPSSFTIFDPMEGGKEKTVKAALLYGRNGTGKSTIAKAFRKIAGEELSSIIQARLYNKDNKEILLTEEEKGQIFVFDEGYVDENVKFQSDHMDTIVMLGEAADLTKKIEMAEEVKKRIESICERHNRKLNEFNDVNNIKSHFYYLNKLSEVLRGNDNWAGRDRRIKGTKVNTQVKTDTYKQFVGIKPSESRSQLLVKFEERMSVLQLAKTGASTINLPVPLLPSSFQEYNDTCLVSLLKETIERPVLSEREQKLLKLLETQSIEDFNRRIAYFKCEENSYCPYCLQTVSNEYKIDLVRSIEKVLSKEVEKHQESLRSLIRDTIYMDLSHYEKLASYQVCVELLETINAAIQTNNTQLQIKIANPYEPVNSGYKPLCKQLEQLTEMLAKLEQERLEYNEKVTDPTPIITELNRINSEISSYDVAMFINAYEKQKKLSSITEQNHKTLLRIMNEKVKVVDDLESKRRNVRIALDVINACLKYIFFAENRLKIDFIDGYYKLFSHGKSVKPCDISPGERNIIALSYFFTDIMKEQAEKDVYKKQYLLVIDDPVSSFDTENRIGILSFLKYKFGAFLEGNVNTKVLMLTHDLMTFYDMHKAFEEIVETGKKIFALPIVFKKLELVNGGIEDFKYKYRQEYTELLERMYEYATSKDPADNLVIGNMMRQVLEAFATFQYKKDIEHVSTDEDILALLKEEEYISYFRNLMYRLVLHGGSHREEPIKSLKDFRFFSLISETEKKKTAKDVLCFIYLLNKKHLLIHLKNCANVETNLIAWCRDIKNWTPVI